MERIGDYALPIMILSIVLHGLFQKVPVFEVFITGATKGIETTVSILPTLVGLITAVTMLNASGFFDLLSVVFTPVATVLGLPAAVIPLLFIHPVSGSGSTAVLTNILKTHGPDSMVGKIASVMCGSSETTFYAVTVYYGCCKVKKTRHTLFCALVADFSAAILSGIGVGLLLK